MRALRRLPWLTTLAVLLAPSPAAAAPGDALLRALDSGHGAGAVTSSQRRADRRLVVRVRAAARRAAGTSGASLAGALMHADALAARGGLRGRLAPVRLILRRNLEHFALADRTAPAPGARTTFGGSPVVFQFVPGAGWQLHPLANFGVINARLRAGTPPARILQHLEALAPLAVARGDGAWAWEHYFEFGGAAPGWVSAMPTATALPALAWAWKRTGDERYARLARGSARLLAAAPPTGVRLGRGDGRAHYLLYGDLPDLLVGNGFLQAVIGLHDYRVRLASARAAFAERAARARRRDAALARHQTRSWSPLALLRRHDVADVIAVAARRAHAQALAAAAARNRRRAVADLALAQRLLAAGLAEARRTLPRYDTGDWSYYFRTPYGAGRESDGHYHRLLGRFAHELCARRREPVFCATGARLARYETEAIRLERVRGRVAERQVIVSFWASKPGRVTVAARPRGAATVASAATAVVRGDVAVALPRPRRGRVLRVELRSTSLLGVAGRRALRVRLPAPVRRCPAGAARRADRAPPAPRCRPGKRSARSAGSPPARRARRPSAIR